MNYISLPLSHVVVATVISDCHSGSRYQPTTTLHPARGSATSCLHLCLQLHLAYNYYILLISSCLQYLRWISDEMASSLTVQPSMRAVAFGSSLAQQDGVHCKQC